MSKPIRFQCASCGEWHEGLPGWAYPFPMPYFDIPEAEREQRGYLTSDFCVVDDGRFFVRGCLDLPVAGHSDVVVVGVWAEIDEESFFEYQDLQDVAMRSTFGPYEGRLSAAIPTYGDTEGIAVTIRVNDNATRPTIIIEDLDHDLGRDQRDGLAIERVQAIYAYFERLRARQ